MMKRMESFMIGNDDVALSNIFRDTAVSGIRAEFETREVELKAAYAKKLEKLTSAFNFHFAVKQNEINALKGIE